MDGLIKMVDEDRYCVDIANQLSATAAILRTANREVLAAHMKGCMVDACEKGEIEEKIAEITKLLDKWMK